MIIDDYLDRYAAALRDSGAIRTAAVERAFRTVRRDRCVTRFYPSPTERTEVPQEQPPPREVLDVVYSDTALQTRRPGPDPASAASCSLAGLGARMLEALDLRPGHRMLEIGAGTGYNAALAATITGTRVMSIDIRFDVVRDAQAAMRGLGLKSVTVACADGYYGAPAQAPYQRVIVTTGCAGVSGHWLDQLDHDGLILAPVAHGGAHPVLAVRSDADGVSARPVLWADFPRAHGPLGHGPAPEPLPADTLTEHHGILPRLTAREHADLRFFMAVRDRRITNAARTDNNGRYALVDPNLGMAVIRADTVALTGDPALLDHLSALYQEWDRIGRPRLTEWTSRLQAAGDPAAPVLVPTQWRHTPDPS
ncbi:protein-L-isoaspartate(D-aspartate) O-methyltransferase [Actinokineospora alba]|uniref:Protein-L-isoaspartate O-methyltransferase n=1 Tax=Actinokineospora alba TaxID=504798 RepID=A0A1H0LJM7_9PSEU|nr:hypothetical protein [Actinokineospora alba]TDP67347.1 protein-L-isoaspartate(D-aspartate) O-methyltransferase [Actinokineospora alba]SDI99556.1 protein-L-isoaspartate(D-aspartate) O-methyltransferase [Actinokineospora alba]SDO68226.1 protein-L-isoaspartate(D-aspartate) O-methyltransferase [Actinokineospora alba]